MPATTRLVGRISSPLTARHAVEIPVLIASLSPGLGSPRILLEPRTSGGDDGRPKICWGWPSDLDLLTSPGP
ncbi:hypothetical protein JHW43_003715 [Diplocarpon mali]|nr:hypothetical protein JHW43_003715 [Diplocarpon mali]